MTSAFIIHLDVPDTYPETLLDIAETVKQSLQEDGFTVISASPWHHEGLPDADSMAPVTSPQPPLAAMAAAFGLPPQ